MKLVNRWARFKHHKDVTAEQCPVCERVESNPGPFPFLICAEDHKPHAMLRIKS